MNESSYPLCDPVESHLKRDSRLLCDGVMSLCSPERFTRKSVAASRGAIFAAYAKNGSIRARE